MGVYTRFITKTIILSNDTPKEVVLWLNQEIIENAAVNHPLNHHFFTLKRHTQLFHRNPNTRGASFQKGYNGKYLLSLDCDVNYSHEEILAFADWITPYVVGHKPKEFIGTYETEGMGQKTNVYIFRNLPSTWATFYGSK